MGGQVEPLLLTHFDDIEEEDLQQGEVQMVEHIQDVAPHQHPDSIWMKKGRKDLNEMEKLLKQIEQREAKPDV